MSVIRRTAVLVALALLAAACGSTAQTAGERATPGLGTVTPAAAGLSASGGTGTGAAMAPAASATGAGPSVQSAGARAATTSPAAGGSAGQAAAPSSGDAGASSTPAPTAAVPDADRTEGISEDEILVGITYTVSGSEANRALGAGAATSTDIRKAYELVLEDVNARGIHGRTITPVWHEVDALANQSSAERAQQICSTFTEDNHVFAGVTAGTEQMLECMAKAGAPLLYSSLSGSSARTFEQYPLYFEPGNLNLTRIGRSTIDSLARRDFFPADAKIGIVAYDDPPSRDAVENSMVPTLARHGHEAAEIEYVPVPQRTSDVSGMSAAISSAVLRFNAGGIGHVMILDYTALITFLFMQEAESQGYRPRYGLNTQNGNTALSDLLASSGAQDQLIDSLSIGWAPTLDVHEPDDPYTGRSTPQRCLQIMRDGGLTSFDSRNAMGQAMLVCDVIWFLEAAALAAGPALSTGSFVAGAESVGPFESPLTLGSRIGPGRHDGVAKVADMAYHEDCACFRYGSDPYDID